MLLQFSVENYLSFKDEVCLNMVPVKSRKMKDHIIYEERGKKTSTLPIAAIYGANACGKSNFVQALAFVKRFVTHGTRMKGAIDVSPFRLNKETKEAPSRFEMLFKFKGVLYTYGFVASSKMVLEEWLFARFTSQESKVFERTTNIDHTVVEPGNCLASTKNEKQFIEFIARGTRPNQLFLTEANEKNVDLLKPVMNWFENSFYVIHPDSEYFSLEARVHEDQSFSKLLEKVLMQADTGIHGIDCQSEPFDPDKHLSSVSNNLREKILDDLKEKEPRTFVFPSRSGPITICKSYDEDAEDYHVLKLHTHHKREDGEVEYFSPKIESDGTRRLMQLVPMLVDLEKGEKTIVIDELDRSMHTHLSKLLIKSFISNVSDNQVRSQFIFTTHDTNLLDRNLLRRDEIWFMEKNREGSSHISSLAEYKISEGLNYENGYLRGRFGAIPFFGNVKNLLK